MKHVRGLRRAGVLLIAAMAVAGCSGGGSAGTDDAPEAGESASSAASDGAEGAGGSGGANDAEEGAADEASPGSDSEFSEEAATAAIEAVVPTSQVLGSEDIFASLEETLAQFEELDSTDVCSDLAAEEYRLRLEARNPTVQGNVAEEALLEPEAVESISVVETTASPELEELKERQGEDCLAEGDELTTDESTLGDCDLVQEEYIRPETSGRRTVVLRCEGVTVTYNSMKPAEMEGDVEEWNEQAVERATEVLEQMGG